MTQTTTRHLTGTSAQDAPAPHDTPSPVAQSAATPATITVANNLSDDAVLATEMLLSPGARAQALFANPFAADREEMVFLDLDGSLRWLTHGDDGGWTLVDLKNGEQSATADEVTIAVHVDGTVWAVALDDRGVWMWALTQDADGAVGWHLQRAEPFHDARGLQVQYLAERPARPIVLFLHDHGGLLTLHSMTALESPAGSSPWFAYDVLRGLDPKLLPALGVAYYGLDGVKGTARVYAIDEAGTVWSMFGDRNSFTARSIGAADDLAGIWRAPSGVGCIALRAHNPAGHPEIHTITTVWPSGDRIHSVDAYVDARLLESTLWEDGSGRYHLYGTVDGQLRVVHQAGLRFWDDEVPVPDWESKPVTVNGRDLRLAVSRPLTGSVDTYAVDPFPDEYPSQHVMHVAGSVAAAERCVIMTQDVATSWWSREVVRLRAAHKPYKMRLHESRLTMLSQAGAPVANCPVTLTADRAVEFRIGGEFYRCGPEHPVTATTDHAGEIRVGTVAKDLIGCTIHATAVGLPDGTSFNPVTDLHNFLGGNGTLPAHPNGISSDGIRDARTSDKRWVFPAWHDESSLVVIPQPDEVLRWCRHAYRSTTTPQPLVTSDDGELVPLHGIVLQTWDTSRPAYEEVTSSERRSELAQARAVRAEDWDADSLGDVFLAIGQGLAKVQETAVDFVEGVASIVIEWVEGKLLHLKLLWDRSENPFQFIQAVFNELESDVEDVIDWLSWVFDWDDILATADALHDGLKQLPEVIVRQLTYVRTVVGHKWFSDKKADLDGWFSQVRSQFTGLTFDDQSKPVPSRFPVGQVKSPPPSVVDPTKGLGPRTNWMADWLRDHADGDFLPSFADAATVPPEFFEAVDAFWDLLNVFDDETVGRDFADAVEKLTELVTNLFDLSDLQKLARTEVSTFLDLIEDLVDLVLDLADAAVDRVLTLIEKVLACLTAYLEMDLLQDTFVGWLWEFICDEAGIEHTPVRLGDLGLTATAFPFTVVSKALTGRVPFPDGFPDLSEPGRSVADRERGPWFPAGSVHFGPEDYDVAPDFQCFVQMLVGISQMIFTGVDLYLDTKAVSGSSDPPEDTGEYIFIGLVTFFDLVAFGLGDLPVFWGCNELGHGTDVEEGMWWGEYFCKLAIYLGDIAIAILWPVVTSQRHLAFRFLMGTMQGRGGNLAITVLGWVELGFSIALCVIGGGTTTMAQVWLWSQFLSMLSSLTAFFRYLPSYQENPDFRVAKMAIDGFGDLSAGLWYTIMGILEWETSPRPIALGWPAEVEAGSDVALTLYATDTPKDDSETSRATRFGPVGWRIEDETKVPQGLQLAVDERDGYVQLAGTVDADAAREEPYTFVITTANSYDPNRSTPGVFSLKVVPREG